jgi:DNA-directed RNA polymerase sigma subunit (sigma70/sigma32)
MEVVDTTQIYSFAPLAAQTDFPVSPQITVPSSLLEELLGVVQALKEEVAALREERDQDREELATMRSRIATSEQWQGTLSDNQYTQLQLINSIREESHKEEIARTANTTQKTADNITRIAVILAAKEKRLIEGQAPRAYVDRLRKEGMTFSQLANVLGLTVDRIRQLSRIAATDQRFNITWHPRKKNTKIIKLRRWDALGL